MIPNDALSKCVEELLARGQQISDLNHKVADLEKKLTALRTAAMLRRNAVIRDDEGFEGNWLAIPEEDFDALRAAIERSRQ